MRVLGSIVLAMSLLGCATDSEVQPPPQDLTHGIHGDGFECIGNCAPDVLVETPPEDGGVPVPPEEQPPQDAPPPPPVDECDLNSDGDRVDEGECDYVPPPPPVDECDVNGDGDHFDVGECEYNPCDHNGDGDTIDHGECDHVCHDGE